MLYLLATAFPNSSLPHKSPRTGRHWKSGSQCSHMEFQDIVATWTKPRARSFVTSFEPELRTSSDISQWTDRYWIAGGRSWAPCASMNSSVVISTTGPGHCHDSPPHWSTQMVPEKAQAVPFTRIFLFRPCLSRGLFGFPV